MNKPIEKKRIGPRRVNPKVRSNLDVQNSKITFSAKDERHIFHIFFTRGFRSRVTGPLPRNNLFKAHTYAHTHTHTHAAFRKKSTDNEYIQSLDAVKDVHS